MLNSSTEAAFLLRIALLVKDGRGRISLNSVVITMPQANKVRSIRGSLGVIVLKTVAEDMAIEEGDELYVTMTNEGVMLTLYYPVFASAM